MSSFLTGMRVPRHSSFNYCTARYFSKIRRRHPLYPEDTQIDSVPEYSYTKSSASDRRHLFAWGFCEHGGIGIAKQLSKTSLKSAPKYIQRPLRMKLGDALLMNDVACGFGFTIFSVRSKNPRKVFGSGINTDSQIGYQAQRTDAPMELLLSANPIPLPINTEEHIGAVAAGRAHSLVLVEGSKGQGGRVLAFGNNSYGQCGRTIDPEENYNGSKTVHEIKLLGESPIQSIVCGQDHSVFVNTLGQVYACGWGDDGQTGQGTPGKLEEPSIVQGDIAGEKIVKVACKSDCNLAINDKGELFGWGNSEYKQLLCPTSQIYSPIHIKLPQIGPIVDIAAGGSFCAVLNDKGQVWVWGFGLLGLGPKVTQATEPLLIPENILNQSRLEWNTSKITSIVAGLNHLAAVSSHGDLYTWGRNKDGVLGHGNIRDQPFPLRVAIGTSVKKVSCGVDHMMAICEPYL